MDSILLQLENRQTELKNLLSFKEEELKDASRRVSQIQIEIIEARATLNEVEKMISSLKPKE